MLFKISAALVSFVLLLTLPAQANQFFPPESELLVHPRLFDVTGVASNDVLNIRQLPSASSPKVGALAFNQRAVEVIATHNGGRWGLVNYGKGAGWISMRFMRELPSDPNSFPTSLHCSGTEPFWFLNFWPGGTADADWSMMLGGAPTLSLYRAYWADTPVNRSSSKFGFKLLWQDAGPAAEVSGIIERGFCDDGMSERYFGYFVDVIVDSGQRRLISGCCSISDQ